MKKYSVVLIIALGLVWVACKPDKTPLTITSKSGCKSYQTDITHWAYQPTSYTVSPPRGYPAMEIPADNPMTTQGINLGRYLFYDKKLSANNTIACASCHQLRKAFTDGYAHSPGAFGQTTPRSSPSLINIGYASNSSRSTNFMWDGKFATLEQQHIGPVQNPIEMASDWTDVECYLRNDTMYQRMFRMAFGLNTNLEITRDYAAKAIAQFVRTLNSAESKYDRIQHPKPGEWDEFSTTEAAGYTIFFNSTASFTSTDLTLPDGECGHCHNTVMMTNNHFFNNGLDAAATLNDFPDKGLGAITGIPADNGKFRAMTLRNIALTAPYMHDGRFQTLSQVMDHYVTANTRLSPNLDPNFLNPTTQNSRILRNLTQTEKDEIVDFLNTLTDSSYFNKPEWQNPFH